MLNTNIPQKSLVCDTRKATVETILKQLEYITKDHIAVQNKIVLNLKWLYYLVPFSSLVYYNCFLNNITVLITRSYLSVAQASSSWCAVCFKIIMQAMDPKKLKSIRFIQKSS